MQPHQTHFVYHLGIKNEEELERERARIFILEQCILHIFIAFFHRKNLKTSLYGVMGVKGFKGSILNWGTRECSMLVRGSSRGRDVGGG